MPGSKSKNPLALRLKSVDPKDVTYNNSVLIADRDGPVHMLFCLEYMRCFYQRSDDDGVTWSAPVEVTSAFEKFRTDYDWKVLATGPAHGIQLTKGRLIVPVGRVYDVQDLQLIEKDATGRVSTRSVIPVRFVPMVKKREG